jgi:hypothetical protein
VAILAYAAVFMGALWMLRSRSVPRIPAASLGAPARPYEEGSSARKRSDPPARAALISGERLTPVARDEYFRQLSAECCTCGCDLNLRDCLVSDQACSRSPDLAEKILDRLR